MAKNSNNNLNKIVRLKPDGSVPKAVKNRNLSSTAVEFQNPRNIYNLLTSEFSALDPEKLHYYNELSRKGVNFYGGLLFDELCDRDTIMSAARQTRKLSLAGNEWEITGENEKEVDFIKDNFSNLDVPDKISEMGESAFHGISLFETNFIPDGGRIFMESLEYKPAHIYLFDDIEGKYNFLRPDTADAFTIRNLSLGFNKDRIDISGLGYDDIDPLKILAVKCIDGNRKNGFLNGARQVLSWGSLLKSFGIKDWATFLEIFGQPAVIGKYSSLMGDKDKASFENMIKNMRNMLRAIIPDDAEINIVSDTGKTNSAGVFNSFVDYIDNGNTIRILGQNLTQNIKGDTGSRAAAQVHNAVRQDLVKADAIVVQNGFNNLIARICRLNNSSIAASDIPKFRFINIKDWTNLKTKADTIKVLFEMGYEPEAEDIEDEFGMKFTKIEKKTEPGNPDNLNKDKIPFSDAITAQHKKYLEDLFSE